MSNYKLNKQSIEFLFDNGFLAHKYTEVCKELIGDLDTVQSSLNNNLIESVPNTKGETFFVYESMFFAIVEYHWQNAINCYN